MKLIKNKNGDFKIEKINFRRSYIEQLTKFFQSGIFDIYVPIEVDDEEKIVRTSININQKQLDEYIERLNKEFEVEFYEVFPENMNGKPKIVELKLNKEKQKLIRLVAVKSDKKFSKSKEGNVKIGAVICNTNWKMTEKIYVWNDFCTPTWTLTSTEFFLSSQNSNHGTKSQALYKIMIGMINCY